MRGIILILILVVVLAIGAFATGLLNLNPVQEARAPSVQAEDGKIRVEGGQPPKLQVEAGKIAIEQGQATVPVPRIAVRPAGDAQQPQQPQQQAPVQPAPQARPAPARPSDVVDTNATQQ